MGLTSDDEVVVFIVSTRMLVRLHAEQPVARILPGLRLPTVETRDGRTVVLGAFDAVYWTEQVAGYQSAFQAACPPRRTDSKRGWRAPFHRSRATISLHRGGWCMTMRRSC